jgi:hypothetical protein
MKFNLSGALLIGASCGGCADGPFTDVPLGWGNSCCGDINFNVSSGLVTRNIASPSAYITLAGVGADQAVTQGLMLYAVSGAPMWLRLTYSALPDDIVSEQPISGLKLEQFPDANYLKLVEVKGSGSLTYIVAGNV